jgi:hypothetical protein
VREGTGRQDMIFAGIKSEKELNDLWSYVSQFNGHGYPSQNDDSRQKPI